MLALNLEEIIKILKEFTEKSKNPLEIILIGGLALHYYGMIDRKTIDLDAEVKGDIEKLSNFLKGKNIPADLGEEIGRWSTIDMPRNYRKRAITIYHKDRLTIKVLHPVDFIISKLKRFSEDDINDSLFVAKKFSVKPKDIETAGKEVLEKSPKDTALFIFNKNLKYFLQKLR